MVRDAGSPGLISAARSVGIAALTIVLSAAVLLAGCGGIGAKEVETLETQIRDLLELPTYEHVYRDVVYVDEERSFLLFKIKDARVLFAVDVRVQAGLDLTEGFSIHPQAGGIVAVKLPAAKILLVDAHEESIHQYFSKEVGGSISRLTYYDEIERNKQTISADAVERGILAKARRNAEKLLEHFLVSAGFEQVVFE